jgi:hypothetical protein
MTTPNRLPEAPRRGAISGTRIPPIAVRSTAPGAAAPDCLFDQEPVLKIALYQCGSELPIFGC